MFEPLSIDASDALRQSRYGAIFDRIGSLLHDEDDWFAAMATVVCELHHGFAYYDWTGFYRSAGPEQLVIGPYQGSHGCLRISFSRGVCGAAARTKATQVVDDVHSFPGHIACSPTTASEIVVPILTPSGTLLAVLDVDSNTPAAFSEVDKCALERLCGWLGETYGASTKR